MSKLKDSEIREYCYAKVHVDLMFDVCQRIKEVSAKIPLDVAMIVGEYIAPPSKSFYYKCEHCGKPHKNSTINFCINCRQICIYCAKEWCPRTNDRKGYHSGCYDCVNMPWGEQKLRRINSFGVALSNLYREWHRPADIRTFIINCNILMTGPVLASPSNIAARFINPLDYKPYYYEKLDRSTDILRTL